MLREGLVCQLHGGNEVALVVPDIDDLHSNLLTLHHDSPGGRPPGVVPNDASVSKTLLVERYVS